MFVVRPRDVLCAVGALRMKILSTCGGPLFAFGLSLFVLRGF